MRSAVAVAVVGASKSFEIGPSDTGKPLTLIAMWRCARTMTTSGNHGAATARSSLPADPAIGSGGDVRFRVLPAGPPVRKAAARTDYRPTTETGTDELVVVPSPTWPLTL